MWEESSLDLHLNSCRKIKSKCTRKIKDKTIVFKEQKTTTTTTTKKKNPENNNKKTPKIILETTWEVITSGKIF